MTKQQLFEQKLKADELLASESGISKSEADGKVCVVLLLISRMPLSMGNSAPHFWQTSFAVLVPNGFADGSTTTTSIAPHLLQRHLISVMLHPLGLALNAGIVVEVVFHEPIHGL